MNIRGLFRKAASWSADEVRRYLQSRPPEDYLLLDVSRPQEYRDGHLPGAHSLPLEELEERLGELDAGRPVIVYAGTVMRSLAAVALLVQAGFREVHRMEGGLHAWHGAVAEGVGDTGSDFFSESRTAEEHAALAWRLEEGTRRFYTEVADSLQDAEASSLFRELAAAEEHHKATLAALYEGLTGKPVPPDFPAGIVPEEDDAPIEGGITLDEAREAIRGRQIREIIDLSIRLETNAYDRYLLMRLELPDENARRVFEILSDEERRHLRKLDQVLRHFV